MKQALKMVAGGLLLCFSLGTVQAEEADIVSDPKAYRNLPKVEKKLPLPANIKIVDILAFGGRFYNYEHVSSADFPPQPNLVLYSPYYGGRTWRAQNELGFSLNQSVGKYPCLKKQPYILSVTGMITVAVKAFSKHTKCTPTIGLLWFDNGESVPIGSDKSSCYETSVDGEKISTMKDNDGDYFFGTLDAYEDYKDTDTPEMREEKSKKDPERAQKTREIEHKAALLFQHHLPIAVSYGDYGVGFTYPDPTPIKAFQKTLNDPKVFQETFEFDQASTLSGGC